MKLISKQHTHQVQQAENHLRCVRSIGEQLWSSTEAKFYDRNPIMTASLFRGST